MAAHCHQIAVAGTLPSAGVRHQRAVASQASYVPDQRSHALAFSSSDVPKAAYLEAGRKNVVLKVHSARRQVAAAATGGSGLGVTKDDGNVIEISSKDDFAKYVEEAGDKLVVVDVSTKTCGPCKFIYPKVVQLSKDYTDVVFLKIMGDKDQETRALMREWGVRAVPNFRFYRNGELILAHNGANEDLLKANFLDSYSKVAA